VRAEFQRHLEGASPSYNVEYRAQHKKGHWVWVYCRGRVIQTNEMGRPIRLAGTLMDITERRQSEDTIRQMAFQDVLTGLPNRRLLMDRLQHAVEANVRNKQHSALLFLDLDHFKKLNDSLGHDVGDLLLQQVAERLKNSVRGVDTVSRLGGDEFVVLIEDLHMNAVDARAQAQIVGEKILVALNQPYQLGKYAFLSTPSIGAIIFNDTVRSPTEVLKRADVAMYEAKRSGRNTLTAVT
jgi:diguanylate cyclase (GGDEF)-like protein